MSGMPSQTRPRCRVLLVCGEQGHERAGALDRFLVKPVQVVDLDDLWNEEVTR